MPLAITAFRATANDTDGVAEIDRRLAWLAEQFRSVERENNDVRRELDALSRDDGLPDAGDRLERLTERAVELNNVAGDLAAESDDLQRRRASLTGDEGASVDWWALLRDLGVLVASLAGLWALFSGKDDADAGRKSA